MSEPAQDWKCEQLRVDQVVQEIDGQMATLERQTSEARSEMVEIRKNFWDDVTVNFEDAAELAETAASLRQQAEMLFDREHAHRQSDKQLRTLKKLRQSPYFGRIDFVENGESASEPIYLGIASLRDATDTDYLIYDWRAPVSSLYYDYPPGPARYDTPMGMIGGELKLKRQFVIRDGVIASLFDTGVTIGDEMLQEVLGKHSDAQMKSIVATIQREQNLIIRNDRSRLLVVQGAAGSGKTSAALQRVAYLLYRHRGTLSADQIVLFSPNPMFNSYVSTVLPELGEDNMEQTTFQDYLHFRLSKSFRLENPYEQLEYALSAMEDPGYEARMESIRYKASGTFVELMERYLTSLKDGGLIFRSLSFRGEPFIQADDIHDYFYSLDHSIPIPNRLRLVAERLMERLKERQTAALEERWVEDDIELLDKDTYLRIYQQLRRKKRFNKDSFDDFEAERAMLAEYVVRERFKPLRNRVKRLNFINLKAVYRQLFADPTFAQAYLEEGDSLPARWSQICTRTLERLDEGEMAYEDATPFLYAVERIRGFQTNVSVRHILIDEAQDYTAFQFAYLKRLFPRAKVTALGDMNQSINAHTSSGGSGFSAVEALYDPEETERVMLTRSYRSTRPIVEFTSMLIPGGESIEPFNRSGEKPTLTTVKDSQALHAHIVERITALKEEGYQTIAVICKTAAESRTAHDALQQFIDIRLMERETSDFEQGVVVIPSYLAKGVEFDAVIVYDGSVSGYGRERERKLFYTVCTRAMHELHLYTIGDWSPFISEEARKRCTVEPE
ncbi:RNA polymerase recycling motor HelD [Paenibacillus mendelii]|uniref:RNA polymerase recycling motor HelD n=1 Tax=Paenibacillus mendelii TaxID=206163 RepID=A0ABV6JG55_9BACL|nr:RNA polymerase recycling motor HelD [Paenibacillus mendelii]MCQ6557784.1 UvrD-helicase domain-containing protein [Paenibacillus mendelii]